VVVSVVVAAAVVVAASDALPSLMEVFSIGTRVAELENWRFRLPVIDAEALATMVLSTRLPSR
jgi:hypothetical protein